MAKAAIGVEADRKTRLGVVEFDAERPVRLRFNDPQLGDQPASGALVRRDAARCAESQTRGEDAAHKTSPIDAHNSRSMHTLNSSEV